MLFACSIAAFAQNNYYYKNKTKQAIPISRKWVNVFVNSSFNKDALPSLGLQTSAWYVNELQPNEQWATLEFSTEPTEAEYLQKVNTLKNTTGVTGVCKHFKNDNNKTVGTSNLFYVELKSLADTVKLQQIAQEKKVSIHHQNEFMPKWFALYRNKNAPEDALELSNQFYETNLFENVDPNFLLEIEIDEPNDDPEPCETEQTGEYNCTNDNYFYNQWGLKNDLYPNVDINMCQAWNISTGANTKIAVIDTGLQLNHPDLQSNIAPDSYDTISGTSPSVDYYFHGSFVAGIAGAATNNNQGIAGVAPNTKMLSVSFPPNGIGLSTLSEKLADGINWAVAKNADVINNSWGFVTSTFSSAILESAINLASTQGRGGKGCIVVFAAGNEATPSMGSMRYPANNPNLNILTVGAIRPDGQKASFSAYGTNLDLVAPGVCILSTTSGSTVGTEEGTSFAAPHVAGVAALMLSVNPCLTRQQVYDIIEQTAQKVNNTVSPFTYNTTASRPNGTWSNKVGYGLLDAYAAVQMAQGMGTVDSYIKDNLADIGTEPNNTTNILWNSPNIWLRNNADNGTTHQNAVSGTNYVYVKVQNKGCVASDPKDRVEIYQTVNTWGLEGIYSDIENLNYMPIPVLQPGEEKIIMIPITPIFNTGHSSLISSASINLIAQIVPLVETTTPVITLANYLTLAKNNNNIAVKSCFKVFPNNNVSAEAYRTINLPISNLNVAQNIKIELIEEKFDNEKAMSEEAEIKLTLNEDLLDAFENSGSATTNLSIQNSDSDKLLTNEYAAINSVFVTNETKGAVNLKFNFLANEITSKTNYTYHLIQRKAATNEIVNATAIEIEKPLRSSFVADAGDDVIKDKTEIITITAEDINEPAIYNWYDSAGNLVFTGKDLTISNAVAEKYKLEVIATADGFKDYTEVEVSLKPSVLSVIAPNPATSAVTIGYKINEGGNAYLMILGGYGTIATSNNYILDVNQSETTLDVSNYSNGFYTVALVVNGQIVDAKTLIKE